MTTAQDILVSNTNFVVDQIANLTAMNQLLASYADSLLNRGKIPLAKFSNAGVINPGTVNITAKPVLDETETQYVDEGAIGLTDDYMLTMENFYNSLDPSSKQDIDQSIVGFINGFCPQYNNILNTEIPILFDGANSNAIPAAVRQSWTTELENKLDNDRQVQFAQILNQPAFGSELPQPCMIASLNDATQAFNDNLANARTIVYNRTFEMTLQFKQYCLGVLDQIQSNFRQSFLSYASLYLNLKNFAEHLSREYADKGLQTRATEIAGYQDRRSAALTLWETILKTFMANLEGYRTELQLKVESKRLEYENLRIALENALIPYNAENARNLEQYRLDLQAAIAVLGAVEHIVSGYASVATSSASGLSSIGAATAAE